MAREATIRKKVRETLEKEGYLTWCPPKVKFQETDIFGVFDMAAVKDSELRFIQYTSSSNHAARKRKIMDFFEKHDVFIGCEIWSLRPNGTFRIEVI